MVVRTTDENGTLSDISCGRNSKRKFRLKSRKEVVVSPKHLQFKFIHMNSKKFQSQINQLSVKLSEDFPDMDFFKEGPA